MCNSPAPSSYPTLSMLDDTTGLISTLGRGPFRGASPDLFAPGADMAFLRREHHRTLDAQVPQCLRPLRGLGTTLNSQDRCKTLRAIHDATCAIRVRHS